MEDNGFPQKVFDKMGQNKSLSNINRHCQTEILLYNKCMDENIDVQINRQNFEEVHNNEIE